MPERKAARREGQRGFVDAALSSIVYILYARVHYTVPSVMPQALSLCDLWVLTECSSVFTWPLYTE